MVLGVFTASANGQFAGHEVAYIVGLGGTGATAALLYFSIAFGKVTISTLNSYGSFMCIATIISGFRGELKVTRLQRLVFVLVIVGAATLMALLGQHSFLGAFKSFILFLLAFFTPWSAINLVDYYCITRERYDVPALSDPERSLRPLEHARYQHLCVRCAGAAAVHFHQSSIPVRWWPLWVMWIFPGSSVWCFPQSCITCVQKNGTAQCPIN